MILTSALDIVRSVVARAPSQEHKSFVLDHKKVCAFIKKIAPDEIDSYESQPAYYLKRGHSVAVTVDATSTNGEFGWIHTFGLQFKPTTAADIKEAEDFRLVSGSEYDVVADLYFEESDEDDEGDKAVLRQENKEVRFKAKVLGSLETTLASLDLEDKFKKLFSSIENNPIEWP